MHKLSIHQLGPIEDCDLECSHFMTFAGFQASGKSTVAKAIYYFRTIKEDILKLAKSQAMDMETIKEAGAYYIGKKFELEKSLENHLREKFLRTFGSPWGMSSEMCMEYHFTNTCYVKISLKNDTKYTAPNYIRITFSRDLENFLRDKDNSLSTTPLGIPKEETEKFQLELYKLFDDFCSVVYIPAGRSMITLLSQQLSYIYATMDDLQKRSLDSCTKDYLERILRLNPEFSDGLMGLAAFPAREETLPANTTAYALMLIQKILRGSYRFSNGEEQIILDNGKYVKINFSSSGQQECVWILNLLFYYLLQQKQILFIIEEPESHLFPESQKYITELIALVSNL